MFINSLHLKNSFIYYYVASSAILRIGKHSIVNMALPSIINNFFYFIYTLDILCYKYPLYNSIAHFSLVGQMTETQTEKSFPTTWQIWCHGPQRQWACFTRVPGLRVVLSHTRNDHWALSAEPGGNPEQRSMWLTNKQIKPGTRTKRQDWLWST